MRWLVVYIVALIVTVTLVMLFMTYGIGGCDCGPDERGLFCWLCERQLVYLAFATSPLWATALAHIRARQRRHRRELYGEDDPRPDWTVSTVRGSAPSGLQWPEEVRG